MRHGIGMEKMKDVRKRKAVLLTQGNVQSVVGGGGLQLKIKRPAKTFAQRQSPGLIDARPKRRVNDELHAAAFVKEASSDYRLLRGNRSQNCAPGSDVFGGLFRAGLVKPAFHFEPTHSFGEIISILFFGCRDRKRNTRTDLLAQVRHVSGKFVSARRSFPT